MPRTIGSHFLMHSVSAADQSNPQREVDSFGDAKKRRADDQNKAPELNPEQKTQHAIAQDYASQQQKAITDAQQIAQKEQEKQSEKIERQNEQSEKLEKRADIPQRQRKSGGEDQEQDDKQQKGADKKQQDSDDSGNQKAQKQQFDKKDNKVDETASQQPAGKQQDKQQDKQDDKQQAKQQDKQQDKQQPKQDDKQQAKQEDKQQVQKQPPQSKQENKDDSKDDSESNTKSDDKMKDFRSKLPTAAQPRTELTRGKKPEELSDSSPERRDLRDTRVNRDKHDSEEDMNEEGRRQIEARRVPEDVEEGRPSPSNVGRTLLLPRKEMTGTWEDGQDKQLKMKAGSEEAVAPQPTSPGKYLDAIRDNKEKMANKPQVRQTDLENKLGEMGQPGRKTTMEDALQYQKGKEEDSPKMRAEREKTQQKEDAGDNKSPVDKITQEGWRAQEDAGKLYHQSKEGKEKAGQQDEEKKQEKKLSPADERKSRQSRSLTQHRNLYEELARRKAGMTPYEPLESLSFVDRAAQRREREEQQGDMNDFEFARLRNRQEEQEWRERQESSLSKIHDIQRRQENEIEEGEFRRQFRERESRLRDSDKEGMFGSIKHFASDKWHDLTHGKEEKQRDDFWNQKEQFNNRGLQQRRTTPPASPTTPQSGRRALGDSKEQNRSLQSEQPAKRGWWFSRGLQHFAPQWNGRETSGTRFIDTLTDDELSMMSL